MASTINATPTSNGLISTADNSGVLELQSGGTSKFTVASTGAYGQLVRGTAQASTSGTSIPFTSIPSWVKRITVMFNGVSTSGTSIPLIQLGTGATPTYTTSGYLGTCSRTQSSTAASTSMSAGFTIKDTNANASVFNGNIYLCLLDSTTNTWCENGTVGHSNDNTSYTSGGSIALSGALTAIRITATNGTDTFDAGSINIMYEG
jgi:hypothetical protein